MKRYEIAIPIYELDCHGNLIVNGCDTYLHEMPKTVFTHKEYPTCPRCKQKFVPINQYKKCFKCRFVEK